MVLLNKLNDLAMCCISLQYFNNKDSFEYLNTRGYNQIKESCYRTEFSVPFSLSQLVKKPEKSTPAFRWNLPEGAIIGSNFLPPSPQAQLMRNFYSSRMLVDCK